MTGIGETHAQGAGRGVRVVVVGGGIAGLTAALLLQRAGADAIVLEASDAVGGRVRTDTFDGPHGPVLVDRGFQVYLDAYPEGRRLLDLESLELGRFSPGAVVMRKGDAVRVADPFRDPLNAVGMLGSLLSPLEAARFAMLDRDLRDGAPDSAWTRPEQSSRELLKEAGLGDRAIDGFFRSFFGGVFFDRSLRTSARMLAFTYRMFAEGYACLPAGGMQRIPEQLAARLDPGTVRLGSPVSGVSQGRVQLADGSQLDCDEVIVATDQDAASRLVSGGALRSEGRWRPTTTLVFDAPDAPTGRLLALDGTGGGPINHLAAPSAVARGYAPDGRHVIYANTAADEASELADGDLLGATRDQLRGWFGRETDGWHHVTTVRVPRALPEFFAPRLGRPSESPRIGAGVLIAGDHAANASINGAMESGRRAAEAVVSSAASGEQRRTRRAAAYD